MTAFIGLILCVASIVPVGTSRHFTEAARSRGYNISRMSDVETQVAINHRQVPNRCAVVVMPGWADMTSLYFMDYDKRKPMTNERAADILTAWEARM